MKDTLIKIGKYILLPLIALLAAISGVKELILGSGSEKLVNKAKEADKALKEEADKLQDLAGEHLDKAKKLSEKAGSIIDTEDWDV